MITDEGACIWRRRPTAHCSDGSAAAEWCVRRTGEGSSLSRLARPTVPAANGGRDRLTTEYELPRPSISGGARVSPVATPRTASKTPTSPSRRSGSARSLGIRDDQHRGSSRLSPQRVVPPGAAGPWSVCYIPRRVRKCGACRPLRNQKNPQGAVVCPVCSRAFIGAIVRFGDFMVHIECAGAVPVARGLAGPRDSPAAPPDGARSARQARQTRRTGGEADLIQTSSSVHPVTPRRTRPKPFAESPNAAP